jgi:hypothetical protein
LFRLPYYCNLLKLLSLLIVVAAANVAISLSILSQFIIAIC